MEQSKTRTILWNENIKINQPRRLIGLTVMYGIGETRNFVFFEANSLPGPWVQFYLYSFFHNLWMMQKKKKTIEPTAINGRKRCTQKKLFSLIYSGSFDVCTRFKTSTKQIYSSSMHASSSSHLINFSVGSQFSSQSFYQFERQKRNKKQQNCSKKKKNRQEALRKWVFWFPKKTMLMLIH